MPALSNQKLDMTRTVLIYFQPLVTYKIFPHSFSVLHSLPKSVQRIHALGH